MEASLVVRMIALSIDLLVGPVQAKAGAGSANQSSSSCPK